MAPRGTEPAQGAPLAPGPAGTPTSSEGRPPSGPPPTTGAVRRARTYLEDHRAQAARLVRYAATSGLAFAVSEATLLILYGSGVVGATVAALVANVAGTIPSYLMSRYWIWKEAERSRAARQVVLYWATSAVCIVLTSLATGAIAKLVPKDNPFHLAIVGVGFLVVSVVFWLGKFVVYQRIIFRTPPAPGPVGTVPAAGPAPVRTEPREA